MLGAFGLDECEERLYLGLISGGPATVGELAGRLAVAPDDADRAAKALERHGLVHAVGGRIDATPPELAVDSLMIQRMRELQEARVELREWLDRQRSAQPEHQGVQLVVGAAAITQVFDQFLRGAQEEVLGFERPPYTAASQDNPTELELLARGVRFQVVYDRRALERPDAAGSIGRLVAGGEQARMALNVPAKLAVADRRVALLSFPRADDAVDPWALMVRGEAWVQVLVALFTEVWERATPLRLAPAGDAIADLDRWAMPTPTDRRLLSLQMSGLPDKAVATQLGMSVRTVQRRLRQLMDATGSATRMQLGWFVARNDWL
ncbi:hypothetical protein [Micromonospora sp. NPDC047074]|uniref:hypothetical protein n=1 Tax=Micromonospora sp. NPDC047074 TaxID=3154339 RepID=UPI0034020443